MNLSELQSSNFTGTLNDKQIISMANEGLLISEEFSEENVKQACYELRVGDTYYDLGKGKEKIPTSRHNDVLVKPRQITIVITKESLNIPHDVLARILTKGRLFSVGIVPVNTYADPGFQGKLGIVLYNASPRFLRLKSGEPIAKIEFSKLSEPVTRPYIGQHGYNSEIWPIPEDIVIPDDVAIKDPRVDSKEIETERAYGKEIALLVKQSNVLSAAQELSRKSQMISWIALAVSVLLGILVLMRKL